MWGNLSGDRNTRADERVPGTRERRIQLLSVLEVGLATGTVCGSRERFSCCGNKVRDLCGEPNSKSQGY